MYPLTLLPVSQMHTMEHVMPTASKMAFRAVSMRLEAERAAARAILQNYWENPAAIGEHPDLPEEIYKALAAYTEADDRLKALSNIGVGAAARHTPLN